MCDAKSNHRDLGKTKLSLRERALAMLPEAEAACASNDPAVRRAGLSLALEVRRILDAFPERATEDVPCWGCGTPVPANEPAEVWAVCERCDGLPCSPDDADYQPDWL